MNEKVLKNIDWFRRFGLKRNDTKIEKIGSSLFNILLILIVLMHIFLLIREITAGDERGITINITAFSTTLLMLVLNYFEKYQASTAYFNLIYPLIAGGIPLIVGNFDGLDYLFFILILTGTIFSKTLIGRIFYTLYNLTIYHFVTYSLKGYPEDFIPKVEQDSVMFFLVTALFIFLIANYFYGEIIKNEKDNQLLVNDLTENNEKLRHLNQELERFNYIASHDLKTPLRSILSFSSLIQRDLKRENFKNVDEYFQFIKDSALQMHSLISDTLEYSQIEHNEIVKEQVNLNEIISNLIRHIKSSSSDNIEINYSNLPNYCANKSSLIRLFQNIFENGIKYNRSTTKSIQVDFKIDKNTLILEFEDNGIGIEQQYLDKIFVQFKRLHSSNEFTGTGLGLSICKKIVEQLNGDIWVKSQLGKGSTFFVSLPLSNGVENQLPKFSK